MCEHTPNLCICGERPNLAKTAPTVSRGVLWQVCCPSSACDIRGRIRGDADKAIADWNRQTAAPDLLTALRKAAQDLRSVAIWADEHGVSSVSWINDKANDIDVQIANAEATP